ncbi:hypothetical protein EDB83DRAFT_2181432, partial [Lactarius deliciosus]
QKRNQNVLGFPKIKAPTDFTKDAILDAMAKLIACNDQALILADKATFRNCLVIMRPKTKQADLPSAYDVKVYIKNTFIIHLKQLNNDIVV